MIKKTKDKISKMVLSEFEGTSVLLHFVSAPDMNSHN